MNLVTTLDWDEKYAVYLDENFCKYCQSTDLHMEGRLQAKPIGSFSLAGAQMKVTTEYWPWMICRGCGHESKGQNYDV